MTYQTAADFPPADHLLDNCMPVKINGWTVYRQFEVDLMGEKHPCITVDEGIIWKDGKAHIVSAAEAGPRYPPITPITWEEFGKALRELSRMPWSK